MEYPIENKTTFYIFKQGKEWRGVIDFPDGKVENYDSDSRLAVLTAISSRIHSAFV
jgi:hypothetical protein